MKYYITCLMLILALVLAQEGLSPTSDNIPTSAESLSRDVGSFLDTNTNINNPEVPDTPRMVRRTGYIDDSLRNSNIGIRANIPNTVTNDNLSNIPSDNLSNIPSNIHINNESNIPSENIRSENIESYIPSSFRESYNYIKQDQVLAEHYNMLGRSRLNEGETPPTPPQPAPTDPAAEWRRRQREEWERRRAWELREREEANRMRERARREYERRMEEERRRRPPAPPRPLPPAPAPPGPTPPVPPAPYPYDPYAPNPYSRHFCCDNRHHPFCRNLGIGFYLRNCIFRRNAITAPVTERNIMNE